MFFEGEVYRNNDLEGHLDEDFGEKKLNQESVKVKASKDIGSIDKVIKKYSEKQKAVNESLAEVRKKIAELGNLNDHLSDLDKYSEELTKLQNSKAQLEAQMKVNKSEFVDWAISKDKAYKDMSPVEASVKNENISQFQKFGYREIIDAIIIAGGSDLLEKEIRKLAKSNKVGPEEVESELSKLAERRVVLEKNPKMVKDNEIKAAQRGDLQALKNLVKKGNVPLLGKNGDLVIEAAKKSKNSAFIKKFVVAQQKIQLKERPKKLAQEIGMNVESIKEMIKNAKSQQSTYKLISEKLSNNDIAKEIKEKESKIAELKFEASAPSAPPLLSQRNKAPDPVVSFEKQIKELEQQRDELIIQHALNISGMVNTYFSDLPLRDTKVEKEIPQAENKKQTTQEKAPKTIVKDAHDYMYDVEANIKAAQKAELKFEKTKDKSFEAQTAQIKDSVNILKNKLSETIAHSDYKKLNEAFVTTFKGTPSDKLVAENLLSFAVRKGYKNTTENLIKSFEKQNAVMNKEAGELSQSLNGANANNPLDLGNKLGRLSPIFVRPAIFDGAGKKIQEGPSAFERVYLKEFEEQAEANGVLFTNDLDRKFVKHDLSPEEIKLIDRMLKADITNSVHMADKENQISKAMAFAIVLDSSDLIKKLSSHRNPNTSLGLEGQQALYSVARMKGLTGEKRLELIERLVKNGANPNGEVLIDGKTIKPLAELLTAAAMQGNSKFVERLSKIGVSSEETMCNSLVEYARNQMMLAEGNKENKLTEKSRAENKTQIALNLNNARTLAKLEVNPNVKDDLGKVLIEAIVKANKYIGEKQKPYLEIIENFGKLDVDPNKVVSGEKGEKTTPLKIAIDTKNEKIINVFKSKFKVKADFKDQSQGLSDKLIQAILYKNSIAETKEQFKFGVDVNMPSKDTNGKEMYPLEAALIKVNQIKEAIKAPSLLPGVSLKNQQEVRNQLNKTQQKELAEAESIVSYLVTEKKADINKFEYGSKQLAEALIAGDTEQVKYLTNLGLDPTARKDIAAIAVEQYLTSDENKAKSAEESLSILVKNNLVLNQSDKVSDLFIDAILSGKADKAINLINLGVDINKKGSDGQYPLEAAASIANLIPSPEMNNLIEVLFNKGVKINLERVDKNNELVVVSEKIIDSLVYLGDKKILDKMINKIIEEQKSSPNVETEAIKHIKDIIIQENMSRDKPIIEALGEKLEVIKGIASNISNDKPAIDTEIVAKKTLWQKIKDFFSFSKKETSKNTSDNNIKFTPVEVEAINKYKEEIVAKMEAKEAMLSGMSHIDKDALNSAVEGVKQTGVSKVSDAKGLTSVVSAGNKPKSDEMSK